MLEICRVPGMPATCDLIRSCLMKSIHCFQWISTARVQAHPKAVSSLCVHNNCLATGSSDAFVKIWNIVPTAISGMSVDDHTSKNVFDDQIVQMNCKKRKSSLCTENIHSHLL